MGRYCLESEQLHLMYEPHREIFRRNKYRACNNYQRHDKTAFDILLFEDKERKNHSKEDAQPPERADIRDEGVEEDWCLQRSRSDNECRIPGGC